MSRQLIKQTEQAYDEVPYESYTYAKTHPSHMAVVARLFGLACPALETARVLEIGCAAGGNLLPQALLYPKGKYLGLDLSAEQIAAANRQKEELGLKNIEFQQQDILAFDLKKHQGKFDYVVVHGVYSWVPETVRERILDVCREVLSDEGLAVVSYNTLPGWNAVRSVREMMLYHTGRFEKPADKVAQARALLDFLLENVQEGGGYRAVLEQERDMLRTVNDTYLFHDHLENVNAQFYLNEFVRTAAAKGLDYVGDSAVATMYAGNLPKAMDALKALTDIVAQEQYMDFIANRRFRSTILCKRGRRIERNLPGERIFDFHLSAAFAVPEGNPDPSQPVAFKGNNGATFTTHDSLGSALYLTLAENGTRPMHVDDVIAGAMKRLGLKDPAPFRAALVGNGMQLALRGFLNLHADGIPSVTKISEKPVVWPMARHQAARTGCTKVTNLIMDMVTTNDVSNIVIAVLDGTRTVEDAADLLVAAINDGRLKGTKEGQPVTDGKVIRPQLKASVEELLPKLAAQHLLAG